MRQHRYRVTLEHLAQPRAEGPLHPPLVFEDGNHDDIFEIVERQRATGRFGTEDEAAAFALGLKLLGEAVLRNRQDALLQQFKPALGEVIRALKDEGKARAAAKQVE
ncbi:DUF3861 domain-containing protein [Lysobacter aestuarii]|uniref:DUF3861 domain-containing protein n=1 Tax=Marilutibacter aestuarii TaxID=1706195 RepID=A0A507ZT72_9GAMM|nr:DUF3861 domain-containing protein [Lysobacter aestuarii]